MGLGGTILTTQDGGKTWNKQESGTDENLYHVALDADGKRGIAVGSDGTILISQNGGTTWNNQEKVYEARRERLLGDTKRLVEENRNLEIDLVTPPSDERSITANTWAYLTLTTSWRLPILVLSMFLIKVLVELNRYNTRLAAFYFARADALSILSAETNPIPIEILERMTRLLSPDRVNFGRTSQAMPQQSANLVRDIFP